jgi:2-methylcitrate dehydratase PrpD
MTDFNRRSFLCMASAASLAAAVGAAAPQDPNTSQAGQPAIGNGKSGEPVPTNKGVTRTLAEYVVNARYEDLPASVCKEGVRTMLNWVGVALGGSQHPAVSNALSALSPFSGPPQAGILGRRDRLDIMNAALINGISSHILDFDDTYLQSILIHPAGPVASAILALCEYRPVSGKDFLNALVLGVETECRIGNAVCPDLVNNGWHPTGAVGAFGGAAASGKILGLTEQQMVWAIGLAASQPVGLQESLGSMNKSFNPGRAAHNGLTAALLASKNFTSSNQMIEAKGGWANTISTKQDYREITEGLGRRHESALNTYKPFACGVVMHPAIDAAIQLRNQYGLKPDQIDRIELRVNPQVLVVTGKKAPQDGLEGKFSIYHAVAVAIVDGAGGKKQFSDQAVRDPAVMALRTKVNPVVDASVKAEQVDLVIKLKDGRSPHKFIEHAIGSVEAPMSDGALEAKFTDLADGVLLSAQTRRLIDTCWNVEKLPNAGAIAKAAVVP